MSPLEDELGPTEHGPCVDSLRQQISFPATRDSMRRLTDWGVTVLVGDEVYRPHEPGTGENRIRRFPWGTA
ncbi:hypothetical protein [Nocardia brevicatena]|uniref:hypothetical protein n=1 Tax=Nocardia brevicatena TaxID=37327 RepID=UPI0002FA8511|nr:hypothetical protein [Nocardia brevicatena]